LYTIVLGGSYETSFVVVVSWMLGEAARIIILSLVYRRILKLYGTYLITACHEVAHKILTTMARTYVSRYILAPS
jgi:hypothetical protein